MSSSDLNEDNELRSDLDEFLSALDSTHNLSEETSNTEDVINLSAFLIPEFNPVDIIPSAVEITSNQTISRTPHLEV